MITAMRDMMRRLGFVSTLLLTLAFAAPAFESHACPAEGAPASVQLVAEPDGGDAPCPDCGPACANGCCHAPHSAIPCDVAAPRAVAVFSPPLGWTDAASRALDRPAGPDRPPRS